MFHAQRWANAFLSASGKDANEAFFCLKALSVQVKTVHGVFMGHNASVKLEKIMRESAACVGEVTQAIEYSIRFLCILIEKRRLKYIDLVLQKIEQALDEQNGILDVTLETATSVDDGFEKELSRMIKEKTGAMGIKMKTQVKPELLGGYLLRIGSHYIDASLKGQLENIAAHLGDNIGGPHG